MGHLLPLTYTRPKHVEPMGFSDESSGTSEDQSADSVKSGQSGSSAGIPDSLTFDRIISGGTCPVQHPYGVMLLSSYQVLTLHT